MTNYGPPLRFKAVDTNGMTPQKTYNVKPQNVLKRIYLEQSRKDRRPNISRPDYTQDQLVKKFINDPAYIQMYNKWIESGLSKNLKPSIDRIDNSKGYALSNIQLMTWGQNRKKGDLEASSTSVHCYTKDYEYIETLTSIKEAAEKTKCSVTGVYACCQGRRKSNNSYRFRYAGKFARKTEEKKYGHLVVKNIHTPREELERRAKEVRGDE